MRVWMRDEQIVECADITVDMTAFIRRTYTEARKRLNLTDPTFDLDNQLADKETL